MFIELNQTYKILMQLRKILKINKSLIIYYFASPKINIIIIMIMKNYIIIFL